MKNNFAPVIFWAAAIFSVSINAEPASKPVTEKKELLSPPTVVDKKEAAPPAVAEKKEVAQPVAAEKKRPVPAAVVDKKEAVPPVATDKKEAVPPVVTDKKETVPSVGTEKKGIQPSVVTEEKYEPQKLRGEPVFGTDGKLLFVKENSSQLHPRTHCVMVKVIGFTVKDPKTEKGRIRLAVWDSAKNYAKEGVKPFRASSHWAKDAVDNTMKFQICGLTPGKYAFFAHYDQKDAGKVNKILGIPIDPFVFSNNLKREGLSAPDFSKTAIDVTKDGQDIVLNFKI